MRTKGGNIEKDLPVINDKDLRNLNTKKVVDGIDNIGQYFKELKKSQKINVIIGISIAVLFLLMMLGTLIFTLKIGGIDGIIDKYTPSRFFNCTSDLSNDTVRSYAEAEHFVNIFKEQGGKCLVYHKK